MQKPIFIGHEIFRTSSYGAWHPLRVPRVSTVIDLCRAMGWLPQDQFRTAPQAKPAALRAFHTEDYLEALQAAERAQAVTPDIRARYNLGTPANPVFPQMFSRPATGAGGSLLAAELLREAGVVYNPAGGTHHGFPGYANGFCFLNDPALAITSFLRAGLSRIAYVDIDAHHPDGVEAAFRDRPEVLMISTHEENRWPRTGALDDRGAGNLHNLPLPRGANDDEMALVRDNVILPLVAAHRPEVIILQCGADAVTEDPQSRLTLSNNAHWAIVESLRPLAPRFLVLGGGGYNPWSVGRLWAGVWAVLNGCDIPDRLPSGAEAVLSALEFRTHSRVHHPAPYLTQTLRDDPRGGPIRPEVRHSASQIAARARPEL